MSSNFIKTACILSLLLLSSLTVGCSSDEGTLGDAPSTPDNILESVASPEDSLIIKSGVSESDVSSVDAPIGEYLFSEDC